MPLRWTRSLRFQLTAWSLATTAVILLTASALTYSLVRTALQRETDRALQGAAARTLHHMAPVDVPDHGEPPDACDPPVVVRQSTHESITVPGIGTDVVCLRLIETATGQTVALSPNLTTQNQWQAALQTLPPRTSGPQLAGNSDEDRMRALITPVPQQPYLLQVAVPWDPMEDLLSRLMIGLALASLLFLTLSGIGSHFLVGRALRPMSRIVTEAEALSLDTSASAHLQAVASDNEIGHLVAALNRMLTRLSALLTAQRRFTADASHELRTPLTILRGEFELALARERSASDYKRTLESGLEEILRLSRLAESLSTLARGDSGQALKHCPVALRPLLSGAVAALETRAQAQGVRLILDAPAEATVRGDSDALTRLLRNLLENAVTYTPPGGQVTAALTAEHGLGILTISDTGVGIAPEDLPRIFERFYRADKARANTGGTGLGLSIVQSIVAAHNGQVTAESQLGIGSRFTVTLPLNAPRPHEKTLTAV